MQLRVQNYTKIAISPNNHVSFLHYFIFLPHFLSVFHLSTHIFPSTLPSFTPLPPSFVYLLLLFTLIPSYNKIKVYTTSTLI